MPEIDPDQDGLSFDTTPDLITKLKQARDARIQWQKIEDELAKEIQDRLTRAGKTAALLNGRPVATYQPIGRFASARFIKELPEIAAQYTKMEVKEVVDTNRLQATNPDLYRQFQVRQFRIWED